MDSREWQEPIDPEHQGEHEGCLPCSVLEKGGKGYNCQQLEDDKAQIKR